jgi:transcriptional regulator GlxA family with amidase domain
MKIALLLEEGATASSVTTTLDMFRLAQRFEPCDDFELRVLSSPGGTVRLTGSVTIETERLPSSLSGYDAVILSGFVAESVERIAERVRTTWKTAVVRLKELPDSALVAASCYGTFVLAETGLLDGKSATTTWWQALEFQRRYPLVKLDADKTLVDSGRAITAGAMSAHTELSLHLLRRLRGAALARKVSSVMLVDGARVSQRPFMSLPTEFSDQLVQKAIQWMVGHLTESISIEALATAIHTSYRTLNRRFLEVTGSTPLAYLQALKIERAKEMLESSNANLDSITAAVGYEDTSSFRQLFKRVTGLSPKEYQRQFKHN